MQKPSVNYSLVTVLGPTASGKTNFAAELAFRIGGEIISADSRQIYRKMNIGTGKDYADYVVDGSLVPYHLIDIHEPGYKYNVFEYQRDFFNVYISVKNRGKIPILCGGTGMYIEAVTKGYKLIAVPKDEKLRKRYENKTLIELKEILTAYKKLHNNTDTDTLKRAIRAIEIEEYYMKNPEVLVNIPEIKSIYFGLKYHREIRRQRITSRLTQRLKEGMIDEVEGLMREGIKPEDLIYYGLEYKYITLYLLHKLTYEEMVQKLNIAIHQFAKRQMTWFRKMEREGITINWIDGDMPMNSKLNLALTKLNLI